MMVATVAANWGANQQGQESLLQTLLVRIPPCKTPTTHCCRGHTKSSCFHTSLKRSLLQFIDNWQDNMKENVCHENDTAEKT